MDSMNLKASKPSQKNTSTLGILKRKDADNPARKIPLFISKTYNMINACDVSIATWSEDGLSFVVKDIDSFSSKILCKYFKHSNISSFVRQLNSYGFRKVRSVVPTSPSGQNDNDMELKFWKFQHEHFQRARMDLLPRVQKSNHSSETADTSEVKKLKMELKELRTSVSTASAQLDALSSLVNGLMMQYNQSPASICDNFVPQHEENCSGESKPLPIYNMILPQEDAKIRTSRGATIEISATSRSLPSMSAFVRKRKQDVMNDSDQRILLPSSDTNSPLTSVILKKHRVMPAAAETILFSPCSSTRTISAAEPSSIIKESGFSMIEDYLSTEEEEADNMMGNFNFTSGNIQSSSLDDEFFDMLSS